MRRLLPLLLVSGACARAATPVAPVALNPCTVAGVGAEAAPWRQVRAQGFTFCVPGAWRQRHPGGDVIQARVWALDRDSVTWGLGRPPSLLPSFTGTIIGTVTGTVTGSVGSEPTTLQPLQPPAASAPEPCSPVQQRPYLIGSMSVIVAQASCQGTWRTTAWSTSPAIHVIVESRSADGAALAVTIMETIRLTGPGR